MPGLGRWRFSAEIHPRGVAECIGELRTIRAREARLNVAAAPSNDASMLPNAAFEYGHTS